MLRRISLFAVVGVLAMVVLAACGEDDEGEEPTVTRIPATDVPQGTSPTPSPSSPEAGSPGAGSPVASPAAGGDETPVASPVADETESASASPEATEEPPAASPETTPVASPEVPGTQTAVTEVTVDLLDIRFEPTEITIPANTDVVFHLVNKGVTVHTFDIDQLNIHSGEMASNQTLDVTINAAPGQYEFYCAIPGHKQAGMVGTLTVQ